MHKTALFQQLGGFFISILEIQYSKKIMDLFTQKSKSNCEYKNNNTQILNDLRYFY